MDNYFKRFWATVEVIEAQWGKFYPEKLATSGSKSATDKARDKTIAMIFLAGADKRRHGKLQEDLNNSYLAGTNDYPESLDETHTLPGLPYYRKG